MLQPPVFLLSYICDPTLKQFIVPAKSFVYLIYVCRTQDYVHKLNTEGNLVNNLHVKVEKMPLLESLKLCSIISIGILLSIPILLRRCVAIS